MSDPEKIDGTVEAVRAPTHASDDSPSEKVDDSAQDDAIVDLFSPLPPLKGVADEPMPLTARAILIGIILGSLVNASNVYLGKYSAFSTSLCTAHL